MTAHSSSPTKIQTSTVHRKIFLSLLAAILPLLTQCGKIGGYKSVSYSKGKLATPPTTLSERDYPFDAKGRYRTDWVKKGSTQKRSKSGFRTAAVTPSQPGVTQAPPANTNKTIRPRKSKPHTSSQSMILASNAAAPPKKSTQPPKTTAPAVYTPPPAPAPPKPKPAATKPQARYHKIAKGDTLWGISRRYKVAVNTIKSANGLNSDLIRPGQTLRIP